MELGASICCDGVCLTVTDFGTEETRNWFSVDVSSETVSKTIIGDINFGWKPGKKVNLERSLKIGAPIINNLKSLDIKIHFFKYVYLKINL